MIRGQNGLNQIKALRFRYLGRDPARNIETLPFYLHTLRRFLRNNLGDAAWLKGGIIEQPAYLIFKAELTDRVTDMLTRELIEGGRFRIEPVENLIEVIRKYARMERVAVGWLKLPNIELGTPESLYEQEERGLLEKVRAGVMLIDGYTMIRAEDLEVRLVERRRGGTVEKAPMLILRNAVELLVKDGKIVGVEVMPRMGVWLNLLREGSENVA